MRNITSIAIHCSATREGQPFSAADIDKWHKGQGWAGIGYHFVIKLDGTRETGRPLDRAGSHVAGHNSNSIGICYIGGVAADGKTPKDTRTPAQKAEMAKLVGELKARFPSAKVQGHRDYPGVSKACPSFDVAAWLGEAGLDSPQKPAEGAKPAPASTDTPTVKRGSQGASVARVQRILGLTDDGIFGTKTHAAVKAFQVSKGLAADGVVGPATWAELIKEER